eukprot:1698517-Rhodomonas_salina.6
MQCPHCLAGAAVLYLLRVRYAMSSTAMADAAMVYLLPVIPRTAIADAGDGWRRAHVICSGSRFKSYRRPLASGISLHAHYAKPCTALPRVLSTLVRGPNGFFFILLSAYARDTRCAVLTYCVVPATIALGPAASPQPIMVPSGLLPISLCTRYTMSGTDAAYRGTSGLTLLNTTEQSAMVTWRPLPRDSG